ncbi:hypothetical protein, partial [Pseudomonas aeruginosa]
MPGVSTDAGSDSADLFPVETRGATFVFVDLHVLSSVMPGEPGGVFMRSSLWFYRSKMARGLLPWRFQAVSLRH